MTTRGFAIGAILICVVTLANAECSSDIWADIAKLEREVARNPEAEARAAIRRGDKQLLGILGYSMSVPGLSKQFEECPKIRARALCGTSDFIQNDRHRRVIEQAMTYAKRYNAIIESSIRSELARECAAT